MRCGQWQRSWPDLITAIWFLGRAGYSDKVGLDSMSIQTGALEKIRTMFAGGNRASLLGLLSFLRTWNVTLSHDRVFNICALIEPTCARDIRIDYDRSVSAIYAEATKACITHDQYLEVFGEVEVRRQSPEVTWMPCWVPDWGSETSTEVQLHYRPLARKKQAYFDAGYGSLPCMLPTISAEGLALN